MGQTQTYLTLGAFFLDALGLALGLGVVAAWAGTEAAGALPWGAVSSAKRDPAPRIARLEEKAIIWKNFFMFGSLLLQFFKLGITVLILIFFEEVFHVFHKAERPYIEFEE